MAKRVTPIAAATPSHIMTTILPAQILADDNIRFGLQESRIEALRQNIMEEGRVLVPLEVEAMPEPVNGFLYRLTDGHYRLEAVNRANKEGAGLEVPAIVTEPLDALSRLKRQMSFMVRTEQNPMDRAVAIKKFIDAGLSRQEIKELFSPPGGRKGKKVQPASNSFLNVHLSFLGFPKDIQDMIVDGTLNYSGAYELTRHKPDKWGKILDAAKKDRDDLVAKEKADEDRLMNAEKKSAEEADKAKKQAEELEAARKLAADANKEADSLTEKLKDAFGETRNPALKGDAKAKAIEAYKKVDEQAKAVMTAAMKARQDLEKKEAAQKKLAELAETRKQELATARAAAPPAKGGKKAATAVSGKDIKKVAVAAGSDAVVTALNASQMRAIVHDLALPGSFPKVQEIGAALKACFAGEIDERKLNVKLAQITGEKAAPVKK